MVTRIRKGAKPHLYIEEWQAKRGLSDQDIAGRVEVSRETVWRWKNEQHRLNPQKIAALAHALDIEPEDLWRPPARQSLDAILKNAPEEVHSMAIDIITRLSRRA